MILSAAVLKRELVVESRKASNYKMRFWLGLVATGCVWFALLEYSNQPNGRAAFMFLHATLLVIIILAAPALGSDTLGKERREGTLGLLFLTPLTAGKIVVGKYLTSLLKLASCWLLAIPLVVVPMQQGGVQGRDIALALIFQADFAILMLAATLLVSSTRANWGATLAFACVGGVAIVFLFNALLLSLWFFIGYFTWPQSVPNMNDPWTVWMAFTFGTPMVPLGLHRTWEQLFNGPALHLALTRSLFYSSPLLALLAAGILLKRAASNISRFAEAGIESRRQAWFRRVFLTPRFWKAQFQSSMRKKLKDNPFVWLEYRNTWSRALPGLMIMGLIFAESAGVAIINSAREYATFQSNAFLLLAVVLAFTSASSFRKERECGAFELILVTPLRIEEILDGRVKAVWQYYRGVFLTLCFFLMLPTFSAINASGNDPWGIYQITVAVCALYACPYVGFYFALRFKNYLAVLAPTLFLPLLLPLLVWMLMDSPLVRGNPDQFPMVPLLIGWTWLLVKEAKKRGTDLLDQRSVA